MSSPSSRQSNPPDNKQHAVISLSRKKPMNNSDEEVQLLREYQDDDTQAKKEVIVPFPSGKARYCSVPFLWFVCASTILPLAIAGSTFIMDSDTPFSLAFVLGIITAVVGACYFVPFMALRSEIHHAHKINQEKRLNVTKVRQDIQKMERFRTQLSEAREQALEHNKETKKLVKQLQSMNVNSFDELNMQKGKAQKVYQEWFGQLIKKERNLLHTLYDRFEFQDDSPGMTRTEYDSFVNHLPDGYAERMERLGTFDKLSNDEGLILYEDFKSALDVFAEMELNDEDIDFDIEKKETGADDTGKKTMISSIVKKSKAMKNKWLNKSNEEP